MVFKFDTINCNPNKKSEAYHIFLCSEAKTEYNELKTELGISTNDKTNAFEYYSKNNENYVFASVAEICSEILGQVLDYARLVGLEVPMSDIVSAVKRMES